jgi:hypothetical protein
MTAKDAIIILMDLLRRGRVSEWTTNEDAYRMVLEEFNESFKNEQS